MTPSEVAGCVFVVLSGIGIPMLHSLMFHGYIRRAPESGKVFHSTWLAARLWLLALLFALCSASASHPHDLVRPLVFCVECWFAHSFIYRLALNRINGNPWDYVATANDGDDSSIDAYATRLFGDYAGEAMYAIEIAIVLLCEHLLA